MEKGFLKNRMVKMLFVLAVVFNMLVLVEKDTVYAAGTTTKDITLGTIGDDIHYELEMPNGLKSSSVVTVTTSNPEVAGLCYFQEKNGNEDSVYADIIKTTGKKQKLENGWFVTDMSIVPKCKGEAVITVEINTDGDITLQIYNVTVEGSEPVFGKLSSKVIRSCDTASFEISRLSHYANVTISSNKDKAFTVAVYDWEKDKIKNVYVGKKEKEVSVYDGYFTITPKKTGTIKINLKVEQDGEVFLKTYTLKVEKYVNPIKSFKIDQKDYAKKFNKKADIREGKGLTANECKYTLGKKYKLQLKKGYKLVKITYRNKDEWYPSKKHTLKKSSTTLPKEFWELYIVYKDKNGRKWQNTIYYSGNIFY